MPVTNNAGSEWIRNSIFSPARLYTLERQGTTPVSIDFDVMSKEGSFTDDVHANYDLHTYWSSLGRFIAPIVEATSRRAPNFLKGELTTRFRNISPKFINFDIFLRADRPTSDEKRLTTDPRNTQNPYSTYDVVETITKLQSLCYPKAAQYGNPPLCKLIILNLYNLEVYIEDVQTMWHNTWDINRGLPLGAWVSMRVFSHQYLTREEVLRGYGFKSHDGQGYAGTPTTRGQELDITNGNSIVTIDNGTGESQVLRGSF